MKQTPKKLYAVHCYHKAGAGGEQNKDLENVELAQSYFEEDVEIEVKEYKDCLMEDDWKKVGSFESRDVDVEIEVKEYKDCLLEDDWKKVGVFLFLGIDLHVLLEVGAHAVLLRGGRGDRGQAVQGLSPGGRLEEGRVVRITWRSRPRRTRTVSWRRLEEGRVVRITWRSRPRRTRTVSWRRLEEGIVSW